MRIIPAAALVALAAALPGIAPAQQVSPTEEVLQGALETVDEMVLLLCDHGARPGASLVSYRRTWRPDGSGWSFAGIGDWRGAEIVADGTEIVSLRFSHDFILLRGPLTTAVPTAVVHGVIDGEIVDGTCVSAKGTMIALIPDLFFPTE